MKLSLRVSFAAALMAMVGLQTPAQAQEKSLVFVTTGGAYEKALRKHFFDPFEQQTGIKVRSVSANGSEQWAKLKAMQSAGKVDWDMGLANDVTIVGNRDMLATIDCSQLPDFKERGLPGSCTEYGVMGTIGAQMAAYDASVFKDVAPNSWADFWDAKRFPGLRSMGNIGAPWIEIAMALKADGVAKEDLENKPLDLPRAFRKLDELKPHVGVWWRSGDQSQQIMRNKEVVMGDMWSGRAMSLRREGLDIRPIWNEGFKDLIYFVSFKGAPQGGSAKAFLDFYLKRPEAHLAFLQEIFFATPLKGLEDVAPKELRPFIPTAPENWDKMINVNTNPWIIENRAKITEEWNKWISR